MGRMLQRISAYYHTVKYLSAGQIGHRLKLMALKQVDRRLGNKVLRYYRRRLGRVVAAVPLMANALEGQYEALHIAYDLKRRLAVADALLRDTFTFLNETRTFAGVELWRSPDATQLWRYQVHYFDYTTDLASAYLATDQDEYYHKFKELVESWIAHNPPGVPDAWHPYPLSLRVVNWLYACSWFAVPLSADPAFRNRIETSIQVQLGHLADHLEFDVRGNHLLKNAKALGLGALHFQDGPSARRWLATGMKVLEHEAVEQALPDGGHFERSWLYHLIVLQDYAEVIRFLRLAGQDVPPVLEAAVRRMAAYIQATLHPDADIPLFGDTELVGPERVNSVLGLASAALSDVYAMAAPGVLNVMLTGAPSALSAHRASADGLLSFPQTGYFGFRCDGDFLLIDCGDPCPTYLPAHAHADMLAFEMSVFGRRFVVDAGTFEYGAGPNRQAFRSTLAHNTLIVNGQEQSEAWGAFRLARRAKVLAGQHAVADAVEAFTGAYHTPVGGFVHQRSVLWVRRQYWVVVDQVWGTQALQARNQLLIAPDWDVESAEGAIVARNDDVIMTIRPADGATMAIESGWYAPSFGERHATSRVVLEASSQSNQLTTAYVIAPTGQGCSVKLVTSAVELESGLQWTLPPKPI